MEMKVFHLSYFQGNFCAFCSQHFLEDPFFLGSLCNFVNFVFCNLGYIRGKLLGNCEKNG